MRKSVKTFYEHEFFHSAAITDKNINNENNALGEALFKKSLHLRSIFLNHSTVGWLRHDFGLISAKNVQKHRPQFDYVVRDRWAMIDFKDLRK